MFNFFAKKKSDKKSLIKRKHNLSEKKKSPAILKSIIRGESRKTERKFINPLNYIFDFNLNFNKKLAVILLIILLIGIIAVFSSTIIFAYRYTGDKYYYLLSHMKFLAIGFSVMAIFYFIRIELLTKLWFIPYATIIILLTYLVFLSFTTNDTAIDGATRWLQLGGFQFQPSEFSKLAFLIFVAAFLSQLPDNYRDSKDYLYNNLLPFGGSFLLVVALILLGRNLGTALVVGFIGMVCYFLSANTKFQKSGFIALSILIIIGGILFGIFESYRADRISVWTNYLRTGDTVIPEKNVDGTIYYSRQLRSYQFDQVLTACGSGGITGQGLGQSIGKYYFVKTTAGDDSIFCILGEELGFPLSASIILVYLYLVYFCLNLAQRFIDSPVRYYILVGYASWVGFQMFIHIGANLGVIPLTGQTLPYISLGGSSIISLMAGAGLVLNASKE